MTDLLAASTVLAGGLLCLRSGRGPAALAITTLLHLLADWRCAGVCWRKAAEIWRRRYRECYEAVRREAAG